MVTLLQGDNKGSDQNDHSIPAELRLLQQLLNIINQYRLLLIDIHNVIYCGTIDIDSTEYVDSASFHRELHIIRNSPSLWN